MLHRSRIPAILFLVAALAAAMTLLPLGQRPAAAQEMDPLAETEALLEDERNTIGVVEDRGASVVAVNVTVEGRPTSPFGEIPEEQFEQLPPFLRELLPDLQEQQQPQPRRGAGSGFIVDDEGHIVTNYHVLAAALQEQSVELRENATVTVTFPDEGQQLAVEVVGANALYDLAVLQLENPDARPDTAQPIPVGDSSQLRVGQKTIAIGNPFGFESTVTTGIVSGLGRNLPGVGEVNVPLVQTDAAINPGNSGGPLLDSGGRVIGVNTAIIPSLGIGGQRGSLGIGFAVPSATLAGALDELRAGGFTSIETRPRLGIAIQDVSAYPDQIRSRLNLPEQGVGVLQVAPGSGAEQAGLQGSPFSVQVNGQQVPVPGDVIVAADGEEITSAGQLQRLVFAKQEGEVVTLEVLREGERVTVDVPLTVVEPQEQPGGEQEQPDGEEEPSQP